MKAALIATNAASMVRLFNENNIQLLVDAGYKVHIACNFENNSTFPQEEVDKCKIEWENRGFTLHQFSTSRNPLSLDNFKAFFNLRKVFKRQHFDIVHCHAPISSVICRLAAKKYRRKGTKVIYTAHGFHFFKGAPLLNWLIYFPIEWMCSFFTDVLLTINNEDFAFAKKHMHAKKIDYIPGVGIDIDAINAVSVDREKKRQELGIPKDCIAVLSVGELNKNKNHKAILCAIKSIDRKDIFYVICGVGNQKESLINLAKELDMEDRLILLGYRSDVYEINKCCDIFAFPSLREGLPVALMEALACGLPAVASQIRGNVDLIEDGKNGFLCDPSDIDKFAEKILSLASVPDLHAKIGSFNKETIFAFNLDNVMKKTHEIYLPHEEFSQVSEKEPAIV